MQICQLTKLFLVFYIPWAVCEIEVVPTNVTETTDPTASKNEETEITTKSSTMVPQLTLVNNSSEVFLTNGDNETGLILEHVDFVLLRLNHIAQSTSDNITELINQQEEEFEKYDAYRTIWEYATKEFRFRKKADILPLVRKEVPLQYHVALRAYTFERIAPKIPALYQDFKTKTRELCSSHDIVEYPYKTYFKLLLLAMQTLGMEDAFRSNTTKVYRGVGSKIDLVPGQLIAFQHFISTSEELSVAEKFANKTLFEINGDFKGSSISLVEYSRYPKEREVLFSPLQKYKVKSLHKDEEKSYTRYVLVGDNTAK